MSQAELIPNAIKEASDQQRNASNPECSVFVSASAGSGKTKLLVDRLLRLMMPSVDKADNSKIYSGTHPQKIQCLTYSNAAAAEMAIRLQHKLSEWVCSTDQQLAGELINLGVLSPTSDMIKSARALFAQVLDLPGGMRIETNHAFCKSILKCFPLEAEIVPQFDVIEEEDNLLIFKQAFNEKIGDVSLKDIQILSPLVNNENFLELLQELQKQEADLYPILYMIKRGEFASYLQEFLQLPTLDKDAYFVDVCQKWFKEDELRQCLDSIDTLKSQTFRKYVEECFKWLNSSCQQRQEKWKDWKSIFFIDKGEGNIRSNIDLRKEKKRSEAELIIISCLNEQAHYIYDVSETLKKYHIYECTLALLNVFALIYQCYQEIKRDQGVMHYSDLIHYTLRLLDDPGAAWVMYKLDGGLDHILLDEVQDNSPEQWQIAAQLSTEFFAGMGKKEEDGIIRTIFAVGDYKQSIYSFQGARPQEFAYWKKYFKEKVKEANQFWDDPQLRVSFRSSQVILDFVDQVFSSKLGLKGVWDDDTEEERKHRSAYANKAGRVELWPIVKEKKKDEEQSSEMFWDPLRENQHYLTPDLILADYFADWIKQQIGSVPPYGGEPIQAGDILILIRKRNDFSRALIRALKSRNIPLSNLVQTQLLDQIAVQDLLALCEVLLLPQDDLNLACVLKSPLGGLSEDSLMQLAAPRNKGQSLWETLQLRHMEQSDWQQAWIMLSYLFSRVDYITPYALLMEILGEYKGRAKLLARLGGEVIEAIDELLAQALQYESSHLASLQGFLYWLKQFDRSIKNKAESGVDMVRIMTIHGAKGLQGRLVILPDTVNIGSSRNGGGFQANKDVVWQEDHKKNIKVPLYTPTRFKIKENKESEQIRKEQEEEESNRLLYVALTRASEWLVIAGYNNKEEERKSNDKVKSGDWYTYCSQALENLPVQSCDFFGKWSGKYFFINKETELMQENPVNSLVTTTDSSVVQLPKWMGEDQGWMGISLPVESSTVVQFTPSRPDGVIYGTIPSVVSPLQEQQGKNIFYRGKLIHELLQYLPAYPVHEQQDLALTWVRKLQPELDEQEVNYIVEQVIHTINCSELEPLFHSDSLVEQPVTGVVNGFVIAGQIDRMRVLPDRVLLCDFKSGHRVPKTIYAVPENYLKQMAAYWSLLKEIYPNHKIQVLIVWTDNLKIMDLPVDFLSNYVPVSG